MSAISRDVGIEDAQRVGVGQHQAGDVLGRLGAQVVQVDAAVGVGADLDDVQPGHRHRRRVGAVRGVGRQHLRARLAAVLVVGAGQQHAGQLAVGAGAGLQRDVRQTADLAQRALEVPHQLQRALGPLRALERVQAGVAGQRRDALVQARVVLHRARAQRVEARVQVEVALGQLHVVAHDLGLGDLGQAGALGAAETIGQQPVDLRHVQLGGDERAAPGRALLEDGLGHAVTASRTTARDTASTSRSISSRERSSVIATSSAFSSGSARPGLMPSAAQRSTTSSTRHGERHGELADHGLRMPRLHAVDRAQRLAGVVGALQQQLAQLDDALPAQPRQVDDAAQRVERLRGADVRRRLLAADVLLARLQREHEPALAVHVHRLAGDAPRHAPQVGLGGGEEAERRAAEVQAVAQRLALADAHVDPALARRDQDAQRDRVVGRDRHRVAPERGERGDVLDGAVEVRVGQEDRAGVVVDRGGPGIGIGDAVAQRHLDDVDAVAVRVRAQRLAGVRVHAGRDHEPRLGGMGQLGQVPGAGQCRRPLVDRRVGHRQAGQLADRGLVLEHHLQPALGDLGLVGRVGREELRAGHQHVDQRRHVVVVHPAAQEADLVLGGDVARGQLAQVRVDPLLGLAGGEIERAAQAQVGRDRREQVLDGVDADLREHRLAVRVGDSGVGAHSQVPRLTTVAVRARPRTSISRAVPNSACAAGT